MKKAPADVERLTRDRRAELTALSALPDDRIDTSDIPEILDWSDARRGVFYRPVKQQITLRLDADLVAWFKRHAPGGRGYQTEINRALREYVLRREPSARQETARRPRSLDGRPARRSHLPDSPA